MKHIKRIARYFAGQNATMVPIVEGQHSMNVARLGAVSYLNTKPLIYGLDERLGEEGILTLDLPSRLATSLAAHQLDVALIPSVEFLRSRDYQIVSDACIACRGAVRSVKVLFRVPPSQTKTISFDEGSRTSVCLSQVLLHEKFGIHPESRPFTIDRSPDDFETDACLVIGDRAMKICNEDYVEVWDLGEEWLSFSGLPFVFAMWVAHQGFQHPRLESILEQCRDDGVENVAWLSEVHHASYGLTVAECQDYLGRKLQFQLGDSQLQGLKLFQQLAAKIGLVPAEFSIDQRHPANP